MQTVHEKCFAGTLSGIDTLLLKVFLQTTEVLCNNNLPPGGLPVTPSPWNTQAPAFTQAASVFPGSMVPAQPQGFTQAFGSHAVPSWNQPASFSPAATQSSGLWAQPAQVSSSSWAQPSGAANPFQSSVFPSSTLPAQTPSVLSSVSTTTSPPQPPPRAAPQKELSKKESDAFIALDPLGDKEMKDVKEMFKDFQLTKPPAVPARRGEQQSLSGASGAFSNYFSSKVGIPQDSTDHDDTEVSKLSAKMTGKISFLFFFFFCLDSCSGIGMADHYSSGRTKLDLIVTETEG